MIQRNPILQQFPVYLKLIFLLLIVLVSLLFTMLLGLLAALPLFGPEVLSDLLDLSGMAVEENIPLQRYLQIVSQIGTFIIPALLFALLVHRRVGNYLALDRKPRITTIILSTLLVLFILPFINWLMVWNESIRLPEFLSGVEEWMRNSEDQAMRLTEAFLSDTSPGGFTLNLIMIGLLAALGEELLFRGVLIRLFREWLGNYHLAIWFAAILFSAFHFQFYGFMPRLVLGLVLGYMFVWSGSLWIPVIAHLINNAAAVVISYLYNQGAIQTDVGSFGSSQSTAVIIFSLVATIILLGLIYFSERRQPSPRVP